MNDTFFNGFMDSMPIFLCVADTESRVPIYYNKLASKYLDNLNIEDKMQFVQDAMELNSQLKYCEDISGTGTDAEKDGNWFYIQTTAAIWHDGREHMVIVGSDYSNVITSEEVLTAAAYTDSLTGIHNRKMGLEMLAKSVNELKAGEHPFTMCFVDIDDLKYVNNLCGHSAGDKYILTVVDLIKQSIRISDIFARLGGDEFLVIFPKCKLDVVTSILREVVKMLDAVNDNNHPKTHYSISYGILQADPDDERDMETLLAEASSLMYEMKSEYKQRRVLLESV